MKSHIRILFVVINGMQYIVTAGINLKMKLPITRNIGVIEFSHKKKKKKKKTWSTKKSFWNHTE